MSFCKKILICILLVLCFRACVAGDKPDLSAEELLMADVDLLVAEMQTMYDYVRPELPYDPFIHIAFADIDFDEIPEFFFGYQTMTGSHNKIWYRAYSLKNHAIIDSEHSSKWSTYLYPEDEVCSFFTGPENFIQGYFLKSDGKPCFVTRAYAGPVTDIRADFVFIRYADSKLSIETGFECNESLTPLKQAWTPTKMDALKDNITQLLDVYFTL